MKLHLILRAALFAAIAIVAVSLHTDCDGLTANQCERAQMIDAGAID